MNVRILIHNSYGAISDHELADLIDSLPEFRRQEVLAYKNAAGQKARAVVYHLLRSKLGYNPKFEYNKFGKPYVMRSNIPADALAGGSKNRTGVNSGGRRPVSFNFSHSKTIAAAAFAYSTADIGLDVEDTFTERRAAGAARLMTEAEKLMPELAVKFWTLRESFLKCLGTGFSGGAHKGLDFSQWAESETFSAYGKQFFSRQFNGFYLSLCANCPISVTVLFTNCGLAVPPPSPPSGV